LNPLVFLPLNTFSFWDLQQVLSLEKWKKENKEHIDDWFHSLAEIESLSSLANLSFNNPDWTFPGISQDHGTFMANSLGHPLIPKEKLVTNSFSTESSNGLNLITGSNMAGKSTFLRSVGVNVVLAMMGSAVYAKSFTVSNMKVISSMRVSDNLEENTSTFYAELKKLKEVIEAVYQNEKVFLLLDEILRGTNSADRHAGSKALIKQLIQHNAVGLIATHDLELAKLADDPIAIGFPSKLHNYHFDVQVTGDELYFDYKLKRGICTSMNASLLMKKIGIEL
jgi:DNA mismatch repair ATPase MutS